jgi:hypothetical protein
MSACLMTPVPVVIHIHQLHESSRHLLKVAEATHPLTSELKTQLTVLTLLSVLDNQT